MIAVVIGLVLAVGTVAIGTVATAEPLDPGRVSAQAKWLAHVDFDAVRRAGLAKKAEEALLSSQAAQEKLRQFRQTLGMDLTRDLQGITFYGTRFVAQSGVAIIQAKLDRQKLLFLLQRDASHTASSYGDHTLHSWTQDKGQPSQHAITGCFHGESLAVVGQDADEVKAALDVLDGKSPDLAGSDSQLKQDVPPGTVFESRAVELAAAGLPFQSPIVRKTELLAVAVGEHGGEVFVRATLVASEAEVANQVRAAVDGLRAIALLQHSNDENIVKALEALDVSTEDSTVTVAWRMPVDELLELVEKQWAKRQKAGQAD